MDVWVIVDEKHGVQAVCDSEPLAKHMADKMVSPSGCPLWVEEHLVYEEAERDE